MNVGYVDIHVKLLLFLSDLNETWIFLTIFRKIFKYYMLREWEPSYSMWMERHDESNHSFSQFCSLA
jgi:hypothetical protein